MAIHVRQLTDRERATLQELVTSRHTPPSMALRARIILLSDQGWHVPQIAKKLGVHHHSVRMRVRRFNAQGLAALRDRPRSGRPPVYGPREREVVLTLAQTHPTTLGLPMESWTLTALQHHLVKSGVAPSIGRETIRRILRSNGVNHVQVNASD